MGSGPSHRNLARASTYLKEVCDLFIYNPPLALSVNEDVHVLSNEHLDRALTDTHAYGSCTTLLASIDIPNWNGGGNFP